MIVIPLVKTINLQFGFYTYVLFSCIFNILINKCYYGNKYACYDMFNSLLSHGAPVQYGAMKIYYANGISYSKKFTTLPTIENGGLT